MIGVDVGGSFTDLVAIRDGRISTVKVPTDVRRPQDAVIAGAREIGVEDIAVFNHASTHGLNAVITRRLPKIAFLTTEGHIDMLDAGRVWRPVEGLTDAGWRRSFGDAARPLVPRYLRRGITERRTSDGGVLIPFDAAQARRELEQVRDLGVQGVAICLLNSYVDGAHERLLRDLAVEVLGSDVPISISSEVSPLAKEYARASTTVVDVFMKLIYTQYSDELFAGLREIGFRGDVNYADGAAHLVPVDVAMRQPFRVVFSGPAAGTMSSTHFGGLIGVEDLLCADVGGTSCDISIVTGGAPFVDTTIELEHDLVVNTLSNEISAIGAGGGSLVTINAAGDLLVGPGSAGANPGPACYGLGGEVPTMTDACLLMGIIDGGRFAGGRMTLDPQLSTAAFERLESNLPLEQRIGYAFHIGVNNIAEGLTNVAIRHGIDPRDFSLIAYGAAGPMLLPATLELVQAKEVIVPPHPGLFSALGLVSTDLVYASSRSVYTVLGPDAAPALDEIFETMERELLEGVSAAHRDSVVFERSFDGRLYGQSWETPFVPVPSGPITAETVAGMIAGFHEHYEQRTGNRFEFIPVQAVTFRVHAVAPTDKVDYPVLPARETGAPLPSGTATISHLRAEAVEASVYDRESLLAGDEIAGPAIVREPMSTTFVLPGQSVTVGERAELHIRMTHGEETDR
jgi:N-methylhydantoinase A